MTVQTDIIVPAYREANYTAIKQVPSSDELSEALVLLQNLVDTVFGMILGTRLHTWHIPRPQVTSARRANYPALPGDSGLESPHSVTEPPPNVRLMMKNTEPVTVYFQYQPQDGALMEYVDVGHTATVTLDANAQLFGLTGNTATVTITSDIAVGNRNARRRWIYRADAGAWVEIVPLTLAGDMPFPAWLNDFFITELTMRLAPRFGNDPRPITLQRNRDMRVFFRAQYQQMGIEIVGEPGGRSTEKSFTYDDKGTFEDFSLGRPF